MINAIDPIDQWHLKRHGRFTASEAYKLLVGGTKGSVFGEGALTYIEQKALEMSIRLDERPEIEEVKSLLWGKVYEYPAYQAYVQTTKNYSMKYLGTETPLFLEYEEMPNEFGGSPDILDITDDGKVVLGAEIKCPKNPLYHFRRLKWKDQWDVKENYILCYTQMQALLMITKATEWHFISFDDRQISPKNKIKIIEVLPDKKFQDNLDLRIRLAVKEKYKILNEHIAA